MLSVKEAAERLGWNERKVRRWIEAGKIRAELKFVARPQGGKSKQYFISEEEIERIKAGKPSPCPSQREGSSASQEDARRTVKLQEDIQEVNQKDDNYPEGQPEGRQEDIQKDIQKDTSKDIKDRTKDRIKDTKDITKDASKDGREKEEWVKADVIAKVLGISVQGVHKKAEKEGWAFILLPKRNGGRPVKAYILSSLPEDLRQKVIEEKNRVSEIERKITEIAEKRLLERLKENGVKMEKFLSASEKYQKIALARQTVLAALEGFRTQKGLSLRKALPVFVSSWNKGHIKTGMELFVPREEVVSAMSIIPKVSASTIKRWRTAFLNEGVMGLLPERRGPGAEGLSIEIKTRIKAMLIENPDLRVNHIYEALNREFENLPSKATIWRYVKQLFEEDEDFRKAYLFVKDPKKYRSEYEIALGSLSADVPYAGHTWEVDGTKADVVTADGRRCTIVGCIDVYSRRVKFLVCDAESSEATAVLLRWCLLNWGVPKRIKFDNGKGFRNTRIQAALSALGISAIYVKPYTPQGKPHIERAFRTMTEGLMEVLPGFCGHNVAQRQAIRERFRWVKKLLGKEVVRVEELTRDELQEALDKWTEMYERRKHKGLGGKTPLSAWKESKEKPPVIKDEKVLNILLAEVGKRKVGKYGIEWEGGKYYAPELEEFAGRWVQIRTDFERADVLYVFTMDGRFICKAYDKALHGLTKEEIRKIKRERRKKLKTTISALEALSKAMDSSYTLDAVLGKVEEGFDGANGDGAKIIEFRTAHKTKEIEEAEKAFEVKVESGAENEDFSKMPEWLLREGSAIDFYEWFKKKEAVVGLTPEEREHMEYLIREYPEVREWVELKEQGEREAGVC